jgi:hypothetical protein
MAAARKNPEIVLAYQSVVVGVDRSGQPKPLPRKLIDCNTLIVHLISCPKLDKIKLIKLKILKFLF